MNTIRRSVALLLLLPCAAAAQPLTSAFTYQGELTSGGTPAAGTYDFRFLLFDAATAGAQLGAPVCLDNVAVAAGRFTAQLDFGPQFSGGQRFLEIHVRQDTGQSCSTISGFTLLTPRQPLTAAPHAAFALSAASASSASNAAQLNGQPPSYYTSAANLTGTLPAGALVGSYTGAVSLTNSANVFVGDGGGLSDLNAANLMGTVADARLSPNIPRLNAANTFTAAQSVASAGQMALSLSSTSTAGTWFNLVNTSAGARTWNFISTGPGNGEGAGKLLLRDNLANAVRLAIDSAGNVGFGSGNPGAPVDVSLSGRNLQVRNDGGVPGIHLTGTSGLLGVMRVRNAVEIWPNDAGTSAGKLDIRNTGGAVAISLDGLSGLGSFAALSASSGPLGPVISGTVTATSPSGAGVSGLSSATTGTAVGVRGEARASGSGVFGRATSATLQSYGVTGSVASSHNLAAGVWGDSTDAIGVRGTSFNYRGVLGHSTNGPGVYASTQNGGYALYGERTANGNRGWLGGSGEGGSAESAAGPGFTARTTSGAYALYGERTSNGNRGWFGGSGEAAWAQASTGNGLVAITSDAGAAGIYCRNDGTNGLALNADGRARVKVLEIVGGSDLAEPFPVGGAAGAQPAPGMLVVIDPEVPGALRVATDPYDPKVAGIISGANGLDAGVVLRAAGQPHADGEHPVAMSGRVWCMADAKDHAIVPGDPLTTSGTPGHAMRASEHHRASGALVGKAMTPLPKGERGLVLVLVNLH